MLEETKKPDYSGVLWFLALVLVLNLFFAVKAIEVAERDIVLMKKVNWSNFQESCYNFCTGSCPHPLPYDYSGLSGWVKNGS